MEAQSIGTFLSTGLPIAVMLSVLIWGLRKVSDGLRHVPGEGPKPVAVHMFQEKNGTEKAKALQSLSESVSILNASGKMSDEHIKNLTNEISGDFSFSRAAGAIGAVSMAAFFSGLSVWVFFALNDIGVYPASGAADAEKVPLVARINDLGTFFLAGSAMFLPYAFNRLSGIFK